jgi:hypothetical protein
VSSARRVRLQFLEQVRQVRGQSGQQAEVPDLDEAAPLEQRQALPEHGLVQQGGRAGRVEEDALAARLDGDDRRRRLRGFRFEDAGRVQPFELELLGNGVPEHVLADHARGGDAHAELGHRDTHIADIAAGGEGDGIDEHEPTRRGRIAKIHG